jgi:hypothetical protein
MVAASKKVSRAKLRANRRNAKKSTGPQTEDGKSKASRNSTSHGIFCRDLLMPGEDHKMFFLLRDSYVDTFRPQNPVELHYVDQIFSATWRLRRAQEAEYHLHQEQVAHAREKAVAEMAEMKDPFGVRDNNAMGEHLDWYSELKPRWQRLERISQIQEEEIVAPAATLAMFFREKDAAIERLSRYEQRLEQSSNRALRNLEKLRQQAEKWKTLMPSPYASRKVPEGDESVLTREAWDEATEIREDASDPSKAQNEPTATETVASPAVTEGCDNTPRQKATADATGCNPSVGATPASPSADPEERDTSVAATRDG